MPTVVRQALTSSGVQSATCVTTDDYGTKLIVTVTPNAPTYLSREAKSNRRNESPVWSGVPSAAAASPGGVGRPVSIPSTVLRPVSWGTADSLTPLWGREQAAP